VREGSEASDFIFAGNGKIQRLLDASRQRLSRNLKANNRSLGAKRSPLKVLKGRNSIAQGNALGSTRNNLLRATSMVARFVN
jgi:hypothetical protein